MISPPLQRSPAHWPTEAFRVGPTVLAGLGLLACAAMSIVLFWVLGSALGINRAAYRSDPQLTMTGLALQVAFYALILTYLVAVLPRVAHQSLAQLGLMRPTLRQLAYGVQGAVLMFVGVLATALAQDRITGHKADQKVLQAFGHAHPGLLLDLFVMMAVVLAPIVEELVFRGFIFNAILRRLPFVYAMIASGAIFGAAHADIAVFFPLAAGGMVLATVYYFSGSLWSSMLAHGIFNAANLGALALSHSIKS